MTTSTTSRPSAAARTSFPSSTVARLDRETRFAFLVLLPILVATVTWSYVLEHAAWRLDLMQATDRAGLYLFFLSPCYAAVAAWAAVRAREGLGDLVDGMPDPTLIWRRSWLPYAVFGVLAHVLVLVLMIGTALASSAIGRIEVLAVLVQLLSIGFFTALGAVAGGRLVSRLTPPAVLLVLLAANTLLVQYGFRRISDVGTGSADFIDLQLRTGYLLPKAVLFLTLTLYALPRRSWGVGWRRTGRSLLGLVSVACFLLVYLDPGMPQIYAPTPKACHLAGSTSICVPRALQARAAVFDAPVARVVALTSALGATLPSRVDVVSRGATALPRDAVAVTVTAPDLVDPTALQGAVDFGFGYAQGCDDPTSASGPPDGVLVTRALLDGWLQTETGAVQPGSFPQENLDALMRLPQAQRAQQLRRMFDAVWVCDPHVQPVGPHQ